MNVGTEWFVDAEGCSSERLRDLQLLRGLCDAIITDLKLIVVGEPQWYRFPYPGGVTGLYLLSESHLACHTYPEDGVATFNLYCCRPRPNWAWADQLSHSLEATRVRVRFAYRGELAAQETDVRAGAEHRLARDPGADQPKPVKDFSQMGGER